MAQSKSSIINAPGDSTSLRVIMWSSLATNGNDVYFDMNGVKGDRAIILIMNRDADHTVAANTGSTHMFIGSSGGSACCGSSKANMYYSARSLARKGLSFISTADAFVAISPSTAAGVISVGIAGPFETARYKDSQGHIHLSKAKRATDAPDLLVSMVVIP